MPSDASLSPPALRGLPLLRAVRSSPVTPSSEICPAAPSYRPQSWWGRLGAWPGRPRLPSGGALPPAPLPASPSRRPVRGGRPPGAASALGGGRALLAVPDRRCGTAAVSRLPAAVEPPREPVLASAWCRLGRLFHGRSLGVDSPPYRAGGSGGAGSARLLARFQPKCHFKSCA